jgi:hypothetical protein
LADQRLVIGGARTYYSSATNGKLGTFRQYDQLRTGIDQLLQMQKIPGQQVTRAILNISMDKLRAAPEV